MNNKIGRLIFLATPIGNLGDITLRALKSLKEATLIAAEDTRRTKILLKHFNINISITSYHQKNEHNKTNHLISLVKSGEIIVVTSDAGTPCLSDPGYLLTQEAIKQNINFEVIPGVSALTFAIVASAMPIDNFHFLGFLPQKKGNRLNRLREAKQYYSTLFIYESPYRINKLLHEINNIFGSDTPVALIREATKIYEETIRDKAGELLKTYANKNWKGEFVVAINGRSIKNSKK